MVSFNSTDIQDAIALMANAKNIAILTHMHPDGDAMGSSAAMLHFLCRSGRNARILLNDSYPDNLGFIADKSILDKILILGSRPEAVKDFLQQCDLMIGLDFNDLTRTESLE